MGETWGLVANEALLAGKPLILSKNAGSSVDFADFEGVQVVEPCPEAVAAALRGLSRIKIGAPLRHQMREYTMAAAVESIFGMFKRAMEVKSSRGTR